MRSSKWRAAGNTYVVVETDGERLPMGQAVALARGSDGVVEIVSAAESAVEIVIWNPDGSQAELSGNGTRIAAAWLAERAGADRISVRVGDRLVDSAFCPGGVVRQSIGTVRVEMPETVEGITFTPVSVGNPHAVVLGNPEDIGRIGPLLESHPRFPERTNVQVARVDAPGQVTARVWERGVGETQSSGTSAVAVAAATFGTGDVVVHFPGGDLRVVLERERALLFGSAERVG